MDAWRNLIQGLCPGILVNFPKGMTPDPSSDWGGFALMNAANNYAQNPAIVVSNATALDLTAVQVVGNGLLLRQGAPAGAVTDTLPNAVAMISQMQGPTNIPLEGTYSEPLRILNTTGQTITIATNTGLTLSGTMTIETGTWRDFMLTATSATTITVVNVGSGLIVSPTTFANLTVDNLTVTTSALFSYLTANSFLYSGAAGLLSSTAVPTNGQLLIGSTGLAPVLGAITGTANQVIATNGPGTITLSTPQDIATGSSPTFTALTLSGLTANSFLYSGVAGLLTSTVAPTNGQLLIGSTGVAPVIGAITGTANQVTVTNGAGTIALSGPQDLATGSSPTFTALTLSGLTANSFLYSGAAGLLTSTAAPTNGQLLIGSTGVAPVAAALTGTADQVIVTNGAGTITLSTPQSINTTSSPTFVGLTLTGALNISAAGAGQIVFPATQNPSAGANTLDDYEEGTFTPTGNGITFSAATGSYTKIGRLVFVTFDVTWPATADGSQAGITNLPFAVDSQGGGVSWGFSTHGTPVTGVFGVSDAQMRMYSWGGATLSNATVSTRRFLGSGCYST